MFTLTPREPAVWATVLISVTLKVKPRYIDEDMLPFCV
jgi:hypothetical protein